MKIEVGYVWFSVIRAKIMRKKDPLKRLSVCDVRKTRLHNFSWVIRKLVVYVQIKEVTLIKQAVEGILRLLVVFCIDYLSGKAPFDTTIRALNFSKNA